MNTKIISGLVIVIALVGIAVAVRDGGGAEALPSDDAGAPVQNEGAPVSGMRVEENAVLATEQKPDADIRVAEVYLAAPGYVVIHEDRSGEPGAILGASALLGSGQTVDVVVRISRAARDGERLHAMLHAESNGNTAFDAEFDRPVESRLGGPLGGWFDVSADANEEVQVTL